MKKNDPRKQAAEIVEQHELDTSLGRNALVIEWSNDCLAHIDEVGDIWVHGAWASDERITVFVNWAVAQQIAHGEV